MNIENFIKTGNINEIELEQLLISDEFDESLSEGADRIRRKVYGNKVYKRGLIEFSNYCKNNCYYCGIRCDNKNLKRYRLSKGEILKCTEDGYSLGFRTFVLQGGEDLSYSDKDICDIVSSIKDAYPDCAITLSIGEKSYKSYKSYFEAGADRYLLRHESANNEHYKALHPESMSLDKRKRCLYDLKEIGYQVGAGFMVGSPYQTSANLIEDISFLKELNPDMIGIGPFIAQKDTPFRDYSNGSLKMTIKLISILRIIFPFALIPATTALGTINPMGRELGLKAGANVVMPNLSPVNFRKLYSLYDNKICTGEEAAECDKCLSNRIAASGYELCNERGDVKRIYE